MNSRERRAVRAGAAVIVAVLALRVGPGLWRQATDRHRLMYQRAAVVGRMSDDLRQMDALADSVKAARSALVTLAPDLLESSSDAGAAAELSARVRTLADRFALTVQQVAPVLDTLAEGPLHRASMTASLQGDLASVLSLLRAVAEEPPTLDVASLRIVAPDPASPADAAEVLDLDIALRGWYLQRNVGP